MKKIIAVLLTLFFKQYLISQIYPIDNNDLDLKGNVKSVIEFSYKAKDYFGDIVQLDTSKYRKNFYEIDEENRIVKMNRIENGTKTRGGAVNYLSKGNLIEQFYKTNRDDILNQYLFDNSGNIIERNHFRNDTLEFKQIAKYDEKDSLIEFKQYGEDGELGNHFSWKYDKFGNEITCVKRYESGSYYRHSSKYNSNNKIIDSKTFDANGEINRSETYVYDNQNRLINIISSNAGTSTYKYSSEGNLIEKISFGYKYTYKYDSLNRLVFENQHYYGNKSTEKSYYYDKVGNLVEEQKTYFRNKTREKTAKYITYFQFDSVGNVIKEISNGYRDGKLYNIDVKEIFITYR